MLGRRGAYTVNSSAHHVHLVVSGPNVVDERPVFLEYVCTHGEGNWHVEEEVPYLQCVWGNLEACHGGRLSGFDEGGRFATHSFEICVLKAYP
jgi:hypothetical protein